MKSWYMVVLFALLSISLGQAWATNPADPTADFRYGTDFLKVAYEGIGTDSSSTWLFGQKEVGNRTAVLLFNSYDLNCDKQLYELGVTKQFAVGEGTLELGAFTDIWHGDENDAGAMVDWSNGQIGVGTVLRTNGLSRFSARTKIAERTTLYLSLTEGGADSLRWGIGQSVGKIRLDLASNGDTVWFRACEPVGRFYPELRTKFDDGETFIGFGLGFAP